MPSCLVNPEQKHGCGNLEAVNALPAETDELRKAWGSGPDLNKGAETAAGDADRAWA